MSDTPASWQPDPTGRHDHRYWDGTRWTEHVADAGVAGVDPYDVAAVDDDLRFTVDAPKPEVHDRPSFGGADAVEAEPVEAEATEAVEAEPAPDEPVAAGPVEAEPAEAEPVAPEGAADGAPPGPAGASGWALPEEEVEEAPSVSGWGTPAGTEHAATGGAATAATPETSPWGDPTSVGPDADRDADTAVAGLAGDDVAPPPAAPAPPDRDGGSRKVLVLVLALLVIAGLVIALVALTGGDDDDDADPDRIADRISTALQDDLKMDEDHADCIGEFITEEIGASKLADVDFSQPEAPPELEDDFNAAFNKAIDECDLDVRDLAPATDGGGATDEGAAGDGGSDQIAPDPDQLREVLTESYRTTLGIEEGKASCLAGRMVEAVQSGEVDEDDAYGNFFGYLEECDISLEELTPPSG